MNSEKLPIVGFAPKGAHSFHDAVMAKVRTYLAANHISPYANGEVPALVAGAGYRIRKPFLEACRGRQSRCFTSFCV